LKKFAVLLAIVLITSMILVTGCSGSEKATEGATVTAGGEATTPSSADATEPASSGARVFNIGSTNTFSGGLQFNKVGTTDENSFFIYHNTGVYETLTYVNDDFQIVPKLAESWNASADGLTWTFTLRSGVTFSDGTPFDAAAVVANVNNLVTNSALDYYKTYANLDKVEAIDDLNVKFTFTQPEPAFDAKMFFAGGPIWSPAVIGADGKISEPIGTGPLVLDEFVRDTSMSFSANQNYWGGKLNFDKLVLKFLTDSNTRVSALQAGDVDAIIDVGGLLPDQVLALNQDSNMTVNVQKTNTSHYVLFNYKAGPMADAEMRKLVDYTIDREGLVEAIVGGYGAAGSESSAWAKDWNTALYKPHFDMAKAQEMAGPLLTKYGSKTIGIVLCSNFAERWPYVQYAEVIKAALDSLGFKSEIRTFEYGGMSDALNAMDFDIAISIHSNVSGDAGFFYDTLVNNQDWLRSIYKTSASAKMVANAAVEMDKTTRQKMYADLYQKIIDEAWFIPLYHETSPYVFNNQKIEGLKMDANFAINFTDVVVK
jgi:peptide/nickel transport system substrate-binding protein